MIPPLPPKNARHPVFLPYFTDQSTNYTIFKINNILYKLLFLKFVFLLQKNTLYI